MKENNESLLNVILETQGYGGRPKYTLYYTDKNGNPITISMPVGVWNKGSITNELIRSSYPQDVMESIVNNHFLKIADWIDAKLSGSTDSFVDEEYEEMQRWRTVSKRLADEALKLYPSI